MVVVLLQPFFLRRILSEVHYCIYCHERERDSCSKGLRGKDGTLRSNPLGVELTGCPLEEKISEAHVMKRRGDPLAALALVMVDNPMCPGTGHRICNDCMKGCIYQAQDPVNIPQAETAALTDVLSLPWGVEIFGLLTRWNPLNVRRPYALPFNGKTVLIVGLGPAGYTLAQHLLNEGFGVVGVDGLKIEPLPAELVGGGGLAPRPIRDFERLRTALDERILSGFGGVSEYGITVRWDKNFLTLIHLALARRTTFRAFGGVRFGGTLSLDDAWSLGFDHVAIASGAGRPTVIGMKNALIRGVRQASDFLMALQLTGAFKRDSMAGLQIRLPALVIGGGLTAVDAATESAAYYPVQVEKMLDLYEALAAEEGEPAVLARLDAEEREVLDEFLGHGRAVREERARAAREGRDADLVGLVKRWGGVSIVYRRSLEESPAYRLNHEEVNKALEEGITYRERLDPVEAVEDARGAVAGVRFKRVGSGGADGVVEVPARTVLVAAGTVPNVTYERENPGSLALDGRGRFFLPHRAERGPDGSWRLAPAAPGEKAVMTSYEQDGRFVSFYGDNHPAYAGSVVRAMASARDGFRQVAALFRDEVDRLDRAEQPARDASFRAFVERLTGLLDPRVHEVRRLTGTIVEVVVEAPLAARKFRPGQFYRLQNYESDAPLTAGKRLTLEGLALTGAWVDPERGLLSLIVLEMGVSSRLCATLRPGQRVVVMGPTGSPTEIPYGEKVLLAGGGLGNAVLFSIARALREAGCRVVYFAGYKRGEDLFKREEIEAACDQVVWSTDGGGGIAPHRDQDRHFRGNIVQAIVAYAEGRLGERRVDLREVSRVIVIGSDRMMAAVTAARHGVLAPHLPASHVAIGSINSPMQCMMKEVCAQCLQRHVDPATGEETYVFSCYNQDQKLDWVDFSHLAQRLRANSLQEKLADRWLTLRLADGDVSTVC
ncbi:MAG: FAD-dependent oxidoreductase [Acidobacteriia bacterium]|nr:FAD-dependent oxidoreductase [Terriglobia bacterium]